MRRGRGPRRDEGGRYAVEQLCDACGKPVHGEHLTDSDACGSTDDPGFYLCQRGRCRKRLEEMPLHERRALYAAQRAANDQVERSTRRKSPATLTREVAEFLQAPPAPLVSPPRSEHDPARILRENAGAKASRRIPRTGTVTTLYDAREAGLGTEGERWVTACEDHGTMVAHPTRRVALSHLARPDEWCEACRGEE